MRIRTITITAAIAVGACVLGTATGASAAPTAAAASPTTSAAGEACGTTASAWAGITLKGTMLHDAWNGGESASSTFTFAPAGARVQWDRTFTSAFLPPIEGIGQYERFPETAFRVDGNTVVWDQALRGERPAQIRLTALTCSPSGRVMQAKGEAFLPMFFGGVYAEGTLPSAPLHW